ncbi:MAG: GNAT family N-acetyltransferase [bacterium]|nr:GNAT family N-acetyltransferase [bacterium]
MDNLEIVPVTPDRWKDLEKLFGANGACGGCWCMHWRLSSADFAKTKGEGNHSAMQRLVESGEIPGLIAIRSGEPVGWVAVGPRSAYYLLSRSKVLAPIDDLPTWSVVCFFIARKERKCGLTLELLKAATKFAKEHGATVIEGYPAHLKSGKLPDVFVWTGLESVFEHAGFECAVRRGKSGRGIWRKYL